MRLISLFILFLSVFSTVSGQTANAPKKISVYKIDVNSNAVKDGIHGIALLFSAEYKFSDLEYASMKNGEGKNYFNYSVLLTKPNNEPFYNGANYPNNRKANNTTALHVAAEHAYEPQNKAQGRRNTGIELFIPFYTLDLPAGTTTAKLNINASTAKGKSFDHIHTQSITINKPAAYFVALTPKQINITDKSGKTLQAEALEQELAIAPGSNKAARDISSTANVALNQPLTFLYSEGDIVRIKLQKSTSKGVVGNNKVLQLRGLNGESLSGFTNKENLQGEWPLDMKSQQVNLKNDVVQINLGLSKINVPVVQFTDFAVNPNSIQDGVAGATLSFTYQAKASGTAPALVATPAFSSGDSQDMAVLQGGKVIAGKASMDSTGAIILPYTASDKISVFYPSFNLLLNHPAIRQQVPDAFTLQVGLENTTSYITQKHIKQNLQVSVIQDARLSSSVRAKDTVYNNVKGFSMAIPYELPKLYFELLKGNAVVQFTEPAAKDSRGVDIIRNMTLINKDVEKVNDPASRKSVSFRLTKPAGVIHLFTPYTSLSRQEKTPVNYSARVLVNQGQQANSVDVGGSSSSIKFDVDNKKLKFITIGISNIKLKKADTGGVIWRVKADQGILYQSDLLPAGKNIDNLYTHAYYIHEDDKVIVEMLKGQDAGSAKVMMTWEKPVKELAASENIEINPSALPNNTDDGDTKSVTIMYSVQ